LTHLRSILSHTGTNGGRYTGMEPAQRCRSPLLRPCTRTDITNLKGGRTMCHCCMRPPPLAMLCKVTALSAVTTRQRMWKYFSNISRTAIIVRSHGGVTSCFGKLFRARLPRYF
jgi:hypothetical protein